MVTVKQLKDQIRKHNQKQCIKLTQKKAQLQQALAAVGHSPAPAPAPAPAPIQQAKKPMNKKKKKKKRIKPVLVNANVGGMGVGGMMGVIKPGNSVGQKNFKKKLKKQKKAYKKLKGYDANPELAF